MKYGRFVVPCWKTRSLLRACAAIPMRVLIATLVIGVVAQEATQETASRSGEEGPRENRVVSVIKRGLTRKRNSFNKAISILRDAANKNRDLTEYYERVSEEVRGKRAAEPAPNSKL